MSRVSLECIGQGGLGCSFDVFAEGENTNAFWNALEGLTSEFFACECVHRLTLWLSSTSIERLSIPRYLLPFLVKLGPPSFRRFLWFSVPFNTMRKIGNAVDTMDRISTEILRSKTNALAAGNDVTEKVGDGKDIMSVLCSYSMEAWLPTYSFMQ